VGIYSNSDVAALGAYLELGRSKGTTLASVTAVANGDTLGEIRFAGTNGSASNNAASISAVVDGTVSGGGAGDMPGRLVYSTTADGASAPTERMRILNDGAVLINTTTKVDVSSGSTDGVTFYSTTVGSVNRIDMSRDGAQPLNLRRRNSNGLITSFWRDTTQVGDISVTTTTTAYNTSSDYRLKENVKPIAGATGRILQLKPSRFNFIVDPDHTVDGFIAHEAQAVIPEAVHGTKDEVDDDGNPVMQGIDQSKLVPLLTAALQEAIGEIKSLKDRVAALEGV